jgi:hypothetical protein
MAALASTAFAQTVTVAPTGGDYVNVKSAVDSFNTGGTNFGDSAPNVILVKAGTYIESAPIRLTAAGAWTIKCTSGTATLVVPAPGSVDQGLIATADTVSPFDDGINGSIRIENITLLPASEPGTGIRTALGKGFIFENASSTIATVDNILSVTMKNVFVGPNNGANLPVTDGLTSATGSFTALASNGLRFLGGVDNLFLEKVTVTHCGEDGVSDNGDIGTAVATTRTIGPNCRFTFNNGNGWYLSGGDLTAIDGTETSPVLFLNNLGSGLRFNSSVNDIGDVNYTVFMSNSVTSDSRDASGVHFVGARQTAGKQFYKCLFAFNGSGTGVGFGNISAQNSQSSTVTLRQCTFFDAALNQPTITQLDSSTGVFNMKFIDCVIAGVGTAGSQDYIRSSENDSTMTFDHCAVVTSGPNCLDTNVSGVDPDTASYYSGTGPGGIVFVNTIRSNPLFASTDPTSSLFLDVQSASYLSASSTGGPLSGSQDFVPLPAHVGSGWALYH